MKLFPFALIALLVALSFGARARAEAPERTAVFVVTHGQQRKVDSDSAVDLVKDQLKLDGREAVQATLESPVRDQVALEGAMSVGRAAFKALANGKPAGAVLQEYGGQIDAALDKVSSVVGEDDRGLLWNLCAMRVHLLILEDGAALSQRTRDSILDCSRRFAERPMLGKTWVQEVVRSFDRVSNETPRVQLNVRTAPANCELRIYGGVSGFTPITVDVIPGQHEVQVVCGGRASRLHRIIVDGTRDLVIRMTADEVLSEFDGTPWLRYASAAQAEQVLDDAGALAAEARADSIVLVRLTQSGDAEVEWLHPPATLMGAGRVDRSGDRARRLAQVEAVFQPQTLAAPVAKNNEDDGGRTSRGPRRRMWADYLVGGGLIVAGGVFSVAPLMGVARNGKCVDAECTQSYTGSSVKGSVTLGISAALVVSGVAVLWLAPFGKRLSLRVANGISVRGTF